MGKRPLAVRRGESSLQTSVCHYLDACCPKVIYAASINQQIMSGVVRGLCVKLFGEIKGKEYATTILGRIVNGLKACGLIPGWPDLVLHWDKADGTSKPGTLYIELKTPHGRVQPEQKDVHQRLNGIGIPTAIVRSLHDLQYLIVAHRIPCRDVSLNKR